MASHCTGWLAPSCMACSAGHARALCACMLQLVDAHRLNPFPRTHHFPLCLHGVPQLVDAYRLPQLVRGWEAGIFMFLLARLGHVADVSSWWAGLRRALLGQPSSSPSSGAGGTASAGATGAAAAAAAEVAANEAAEEEDPGLGLR